MKPIINLPFGESLKRTYLYVFANFGKAMKICSFWIVLMLAADVLMSFPSQCREGQNCIGWQSNVSMLLSVIASAAVSVSFARTVILKEEYDLNEARAESMRAKYGSIDWHQYCSGCTAESIRVCKRLCNDLETV